MVSAVDIASTRKYSKGTVMPNEAMAWLGKGNQHGGRDGQ
jgi:hypothetical protein